MAYATIEALGSMVPKKNWLTTEPKATKTVKKTAAVAGEK
jgi:hypothetical protein